MRPCSATSRLLFFCEKLHNIKAPVNRDVSISAVKTQVGVIVGPSSLTHCSSSHSGSSTFFAAAALFPTDALALYCFCLAAVYLRTCPNSIRPKMIQHAGSRALHVVCLPRGLESCRYGGAVGVTFSELGPDSSGDRSSMPSEAMSVTARNDGLRRRGGTESSLSTEEQPAAGCWCRVAPVQQPR